MDSSASVPEPARPIVVGVDGSEESTLAVQWASRSASRRHRTLRIVHGYNRSTSRTLLGSNEGNQASVKEAVRARGQQYLDNARAIALRIAPSLSVETELSEVAPASLLIEESATAEMTVIGPAGEGSSLAHLGSTLLSVVGRGHGKVIVAKDTGRTRNDARPVVVGLDGTPSSDAAAGAAFAEAAAMRVRLVAVHTLHDLRKYWFAGMPETIDDPAVARATHARLTEWLDKWVQKYPEVEVIRKVYLAGPDLHLLHWSETAQLVVVGSHGRGGFRALLLGSTSNIVVQRADCPVLVAHEK